MQSRGLSLQVQKKGEQAGEDRLLSTLDLLFPEWVQRGPALPVGSHMVRDVLGFS